MAIRKRITETPAESLYVEVSVRVALDGAMRYPGRTRRVTRKGRLSILCSDTAAGSMEVAYCEQGKWFVLRGLLPQER